MISWITCWFAVMGRGLILAFLGLVIPGQGPCLRKEKLWEKKLILQSLIGRSASSGA